MTMSPLPYDLAEAVRAARKKRIEEIELEAANPRLHTRQHADVRTAAPANDPIHGGPGVPTPQVERLYRLEREHGHQRSTDEPKPWKKPWDR
jgi:hypothetical protein